MNVGFARGASKARAEVKPVTCACVTVPEYDPAVVAVAALPLILIAYVAFGSTTVPVSYTHLDVYKRQHYSTYMR